MDSRYDVIVVGLGSMGSAAARTLAARGLRALGLERFGPAHDQGSHHGATRVVRQSYFEGAAYVPLLRSAYEGWRRLQAESGRDLLRLCGGLYVGDPEGAVFTGSLHAARVHGLDHEVLDAAEIHRRFPTFAPPEHALGLYETNAGYVRPEQTVLAQLDLARRDGADLRFDAPVERWSATPDGGVEVVTREGTFGADRLVLAAGAWTSRLLEGPNTLYVEREIVYWITPGFTADVPYAAYASEQHPVFLEETDGNGELYGFPMIDGPEGGMKVAFYREPDAVTTPETVDRTVHPEEVERLRTRARQLVPGLTGPLVKASTCLYASTADDDFVIGALPAAPQVVLACGFSGHGFKFVPVVGEIVADLVQHGRTPHDLSLFDVERAGFTGA